MYLRLVSDVRMVLAHRGVARYLLAERLDLLDVLLHSLACLQGMNAYQRKADEHVQWASQLWQHAVSLELHLLMLVRLLSFTRITQHLHPTYYATTTHLRVLARRLHFSSERLRPCPVCCRHGRCSARLLVELTPAAHIMGPGGAFVEFLRR